MESTKNEPKAVECEAINSQAAKKDPSGEESFSVEDIDFILAKFDCFQEKCQLLNRSFYFGSDLLEILVNMPEKIKTVNPSDYIYYVKAEDNQLYHGERIKLELNWNTVKNFTQIKNCLNNFFSYFFLILPTGLISTYIDNLMSAKDKNVFMLLLVLFKKIEEEPPEDLEEIICKETYRLLLILCFDPTIMGNFIYKTGENDKILHTLSNFFESNPSELGQKKLPKPYCDMKTCFLVFHFQNFEKRNEFYRIKCPTILLFEAFPIYVFMKVPRGTNIKLKDLLQILIFKKRYRLFSILTTMKSAILGSIMDETLKKVKIVENLQIELSDHFVRNPYSICLFQME